VAAIAAEGAEVTRIDGSYEEAVAAAADAAEGPDAVLVQDTAWAGYERIPAWIIEGYETLFVEIDEQLRAAGIARPDLVIVPVGVGSLLHAALAHYRSRPTGTAVVSVEPDVAACLPPSLAAGHPVTIPTGTTIMAGLNCGTPSTLAWPYIVNGLDAATTVADADVIDAAHRLAELGIPAGPCGAAGLAAARAVFTGPDAAQRARHLGVDGDSTVVLLVTEGSESNPVPAR
jgi:diaminopropionate ammonia-lyase